VAVSGTGVHAVMGIGGAPEGVLSAAALKCLGGEIQARFKWRSNEERERARGMGVDVDDTERVYTTDDLASGSSVVFCATGVTDGELLRGVRFFGGGARTHSLMLSYAAGVVRFIDTVHMWDQGNPPKVRL
jgi:fructose-1,6-bisphosphatase II